MIEKKFKKGDVILRQGEIWDNMYQIKDGSVGVYVNYGKADQVMLTELGEDQFFGEMAVIEVYPRSASVVALETTNVYEISISEISKYFESQPDKIADIMKNLCNRLRQLTNDYDDVTNTITELRSGEDKANRSEGFVNKILKFVKVSKAHKNLSDFNSVESLRQLDARTHSKGYYKNVDSFSKGTIIFKEGLFGDCMYDIHQGRVGIFKNYGQSNEKLLAELHADEFFGEMGLLEDDRRSATAVVLEDNTVIETIYSKDLEELFEKNPPKVEMIMDHISHRLRKLTVAYFDACKMVFDIYNAEQIGSVNAEASKEAKDSKSKLYV